MARRRRRTRTGPQCSTCKASIKWIRLRGNWRTFDPKPLDGKQHAGLAYPTENNGTTASPFEELVDDLQGRLGITRVEAEDHAYAMPWYALHACPPETTTTEGTTQ